jgi:GT2 family glycosyltransferase
VDRSGKVRPEVDLPVDVIVPVFNSMHVARPCLESVLGASTGTFRVLIVDDGSDAYTSSALADIARSSSQSTVLTQPRNLGFVHAANAGLSMTTAPIVVLLNSDTVVPPGWLDRIRTCFSSDRRIGVASPVSNFAPHNRIPMLPGFDARAMDELTASFSGRTYPDVTTPEGFCYAIRREALIQLGPFDAVFDRGYGEESDYAMRAVYHGWRTVVIDDLYVYHRGRGTFGADVRDELYNANKGIFHDRWGHRYKQDFEDFMRRQPLDRLRSRLAGVPPDGVTSAFEGN